MIVCVGEYDTKTQSYYFFCLKPTKYTAVVCMTDSTHKKEKKSFMEKLKGLFKKKPKPKTEVADSTAVSEQEVNPSDSTSTITQPVVQKKKGLLGKKSKTAPPETPKKKADAKKEEDDGF